MTPIILIKRGYSSKKEDVSMKKSLVILILLIFVTSSTCQAFTCIVEEERIKSFPFEEKMLGIDANYVTSMQYSFFHWRYHFKNIDIYSFFHDKGINYFRLRIFVKDNGSDSLPYAINTAKLVQAQGMKCSVTLFMSSDWADLGKQPAPEQWNTLYDFSNLSLECKTGIIRNYTQNTTRSLLNNGIDADLYEIGNEIDYGFCGIFEQNLTKRENISWMRNTTWMQEAYLLKAGMEGVQSVDPTSQFILHIAHWWDYNFSAAFFETMTENDFPLGYLGLSFYPSSGIFNITLAYQGIGNGTLSQLLFRQTTEKLADTFGKPLIISEYAYPSSSLILGMFSSFNHAVQGFPLTRQGQKAWLRDFLQWVENHSFIAGTFYFSPEFHRIIWVSFCLFTFFGNAKPAIDVFEEFSYL
jgi:arabinogalactan endo-1,4-beta-galactosidase